MRALYAYLTRGLAPVSQPNKPADMAWPFSMRWGLSLWNWAFLDDTPFKPDPGHDAVWNRGAYLVQGLGHCGACHTPRGIGFQEKAMTQEGGKGDAYLAGETVDVWRAPSLRNLWTVPDTVVMLKTGQNRFGSVSGSMVEVIHNSTQHFSDSDLDRHRHVPEVAAARQERGADARGSGPRRASPAPGRTVHDAGRPGLRAVLRRLPPPGRHRRQGHLPAAGAQPHRRIGRPRDAASRRPDRLEDGADRRLSARVHHAGLQPPVRPGAGRHHELRAPKLGQQRRAHQPPIR